MIKWEYNRFEGYASDIAKFNELGKDGWECYGVLPDMKGGYSSAYGVFLFKRPLP